MKPVKKGLNPAPIINSEELKIETVSQLLPCPDTDECEEVFSTDCIIYTGTELVCQDETIVNTDDTVTEAIQGIVEYVCDHVGNEGPQGAQGVQGTQGTQGVQGRQGVQGVQGVQGIQGTQGLQGLQGIQGTQGSQGLQGIQGTQGTQGFQGTQGLQGIQGLQGTQGTLGATGNTGAPGSQGATGAAGSNGSQGATGASGSQGVQGRQGVQGSQGTQGLVGPIGFTGAQGTTGATGGAGAQGAQGVQGLEGLGLTGPQGATGAQGPAGSGGGGVGGRCSTDATLIASTSGYFISQGDGVTFIGNNELCGWNNCLWNEDRICSRELPVYAVSCTVPLSIDLAIFDEIRICGTAIFDQFDSNTDSGTLMVGLGSLLCDPSTNNIPTTCLIDPNTHGGRFEDTEAGLLCFDATYVVANDALLKCRNHLIVYLGVQNGSGTYPANIKFSYSLTAVKTCVDTYYDAQPCCGGSNELVYGTYELGVTYVDTNGHCFTIIGYGSAGTPTITLISSLGYVDCPTCTTAHPCP